jgi:hypothetical protein
MPLELQQPSTAKRQLSKTEKRALVVGVGTVIALIALMHPDSPLARWAKHHDAISRRDKIASVMIPLAKAGRPDAVIWYALHYPDASLEPLHKLAEAGNPQALWTLAGFEASSNRPDALRLARLAADAGYPDAVSYEVQTGAAVKPTAASSDAGTARTVGKS